MAQGKSKKGINKKIFFLVLILISALAALISMEYGKTVTEGRFSQDSSVKDFEYDAGSKADFAAFDGFVYYCTKDGMQYINSAGEVLWNDTFNMTTPYMVQNMGTVGVSEQKGRVVIVYGEDGKMYSAQTDNPIVSFSINSQGFASIITSSENEYQLEVYNNKGDKSFYGNFQVLQGIPISSSISPDGNILAVSFMNIGEVDVNSRISFYDINPKTKKTGETNDSVFASFDDKSVVCGVISFIDNDCAAVVSDKALTLINVNPYENEKYSQKAKIEFKNQIKQVAFDIDSNIYLAFGDKLMNSGKDALESGTLQCYDKNGTKRFEIQTKRKITGIYPGSDGNTIVGMDRKFQNYNSSGGLVWEHNMNQDTMKLLIIDEELILFVGSNKASIIKLNDLTTREEQEQAETRTESTTIQQTTESTTVQQTTETSQTTTVKPKSDSNSGAGIDSNKTKNNDKKSSDKTDSSEKTNASEQNVEKQTTKKQVSTQNNVESKKTENKTQNTVQPEETPKEQKQEDNPVKSEETPIDSVQNKEPTVDKPAENENSNSDKPAQNAGSDNANVISDDDIVLPE